MWEGELRPIVVQGNELGQLAISTLTITAGLLYKHNKDLEQAGQQEFDGVNENMISRLDFSMFTVNKQR
jgi:hypothetical protein